AKYATGLAAVRRVVVAQDRAHGRSTRWRSARSAIRAGHEFDRCRAGLPVVATHREDHPRVFVAINHDSIDRNACFLQTIRHKSCLADKAGVLVLAIHQQERRCVFIYERNYGCFVLPYAGSIDLAITCVEIFAVRPERIRFGILKVVPGTAYTDDATDDVRRRTEATEN